ncbi:hypothetical protein D3C72_2437690 [compost metagenome]
MPVDSTKMIITTRHMDSTGAKWKVGAPKCMGVTMSNHGRAAMPDRSTIPMKLATT